ncbi:MAG: carbon storage regulator [Thioalkalispiraceae bacterium]|jgi:carbon storage regulator
MLILTRRNGESLQIVTRDNEVIEIKITNVRGEQVKIGFDAPPECRILRQELIEEVDAV